MYNATMGTNPINKSIRSSKEFLNLFYHELQGIQLTDNKKLDLFILKTRNSRFDYDTLIPELSNNLINYALSRKEIENFVKEGRFGELNDRAKEKLRKAASNDGELGELLLYCFLESHLEAPKIISKLELKTAGNDYVKGSDGIHLLKISEEEYQLIYGESKVHKSLVSGISEAVKSIKLLKSEGKISYERGLINANLIKECLSENEYKIVKRILFPALSKDNIPTDDAFGILLGFNVDFDEEMQAKGTMEFTVALREQIKNEVLSKKETIAKALEDKELNFHNVYLYIIPLSDISNTRKELIRKIK